MKKKKSLLLFLAATSASFVQAALPVHTSFAAGIENVQEKGHTFVKGRVIDSEGNPLVGVTVQIEGTSYGVITDADGNYILEFPSMAHPKIVFSSIGYKSKSIEFRGVKEQNMMLELDHVALDDLVVIGYGSKSRRECNYRYFYRESGTDKQVGCYHTNPRWSSSGYCKGRIGYYRKW